MFSRIAQHLANGVSRGLTMTVTANWRFSADTMRDGKRYGTRCAGMGFPGGTARAPAVELVAAPMPL
jgi:hypothetical protein